MGRVRPTLWRLQRGFDHVWRGFVLRFRGMRGGSTAGLVQTRCQHGVLTPCIPKNVGDKSKHTSGGGKRATNAHPCQREPRRSEGGALEGGGRGPLAGRPTETAGGVRAASRGGAPPSTAQEAGRKPSTRAREAVGNNTLRGRRPRKRNCEWAGSGARTQHATCGRRDTAKSRDAAWRMAGLHELPPGPTCHTRQRIGGTQR